MGREIRELSAIVLGIEPQGEGFLRLSVLGREHGLQSVLLRLSRRKAAPDLFDQLEVFWQQRPGSGIGFVIETRLLQRFERLGNSLAALSTASAHARIVARNASHFEDPAPIHDLTLQLLQHLQEGLDPALASLKALYLLARAEGFPVKEAWLQRLPPGQRQRATEALQSPLDTHPAPPAGETLESLRNWLQREADFHLA